MYDLNDDNKNCRDIDVTPNDDAYECPNLRTPLFQIEDQTSSDNHLKHTLWWKTEFHSTIKDDKLIKVV